LAIPPATIIAPAPIKAPATIGSMALAGPTVTREAKRQKAVNRIMVFFMAVTSFLFFLTIEKRKG
jgi:hypothetical protein